MQGMPVHTTGKAGLKFQTQTGKLNLLTDQFSHQGQSIQTVWELHQEAAKAPFDRWGQHLAHLFTKNSTSSYVFKSCASLLAVSLLGIMGACLLPTLQYPQVIHKGR